MELEGGKLPAVIVAVGAANATPAVAVVAGSGPAPETEGAVEASPIVRLARRLHTLKDAKITQHK